MRSVVITRQSSSSRPSGVTIPDCRATAVSAVIALIRRGNGLPMPHFFSTATRPGRPRHTECYAATPSSRENFAHDAFDLGLWVDIIDRRIPKTDHRTGELWVVQAFLSCRCRRSLPSRVSPFPACAELDRSTRIGSAFGRHVRRLDSTITNSSLAPSIEGCFYRRSRRADHFAEIHCYLLHSFPITLYSPLSTLHSPLSTPHSPLFS